MAVVQTPAHPSDEIEFAACCTAARPRSTG